MLGHSSQYKMQLSNFLFNFHPAIGACFFNQQPPGNALLVEVMLALQTPWKVKCAFCKAYWAGSLEQGEHNIFEYNYNIYLEFNIWEIWEAVSVRARIRIRHFSWIFLWNNLIIQLLDYSILLSLIIIHFYSS